MAAAAVAEGAVVAAAAQPPFPPSSAPALAPSLEAAGEVAAEVAAEVAVAEVAEVPAAGLLQPQAAQPEAPFQRLHPPK